MVKDIHPHFLVPSVGYMWKVNTDMSPIPAVLAGTTSPSHDTVTAFAIYKLIEAEGGDVSAELADLLPLVMTFFEQPASELLRGAYDALGLGCHLWILQFLDPLEVSVPSSDQQEKESASAPDAVDCGVPISHRSLVVNTLSRHELLQQHCTL